MFGYRHLVLIIHYLLGGIIEQMNINSKTVVVVMPVYNSAKTLSYAIESVLNQTYKNLFLIIVDDASMDDTLNVAKSYLSDPRVVVFHNKINMGAYYSRNVGLQYFQNKPWGFFTTHDADDISYSDRYSIMVKTLQKPRYVAVQDKFRKLDLYTNEHYGDHLTMAHAMFKKSVFDDLGYFEVVRFGADWEYWHKLTSKNKLTMEKTGSIHKVLGESYVHENNLTVQIPLNSRHRRNYIHKVQKEVSGMHRAKYWHRGFDINKEITERVS